MQSVPRSGRGVNVASCISEADPDISIRGIRFISETIFFYRNIKRYRDVIQRENYTRHGKKKTDKDETGNILLKYVFTSL